MNVKLDKYETIYRAERHALGEPSPELVKFFEKLPQSPINVLDLGCGQGRDALFIAHMGHRVVAVDSSATGISQLNTDAKAEVLPIRAMVGNLNDYRAEGFFDVVVIDRTLHMLPERERLLVLQRTLGVVSPNGHVLIADEKENLPVMIKVFDKDENVWAEIFAQKGFVFMQRTGIH